MKQSLHILLALLALLALLILPACGGLKEMRVTEGNQPEGTMATETPDGRKNASIVHVNLSSRVATIRKGHSFNAGDFLIVKNREGTQTGILKARNSRPIGLRTADVLEGEPDISHIVTRASASEAARLEKIYRDPEE